MSARQPSRSQAKPAPRARPRHAAPVRGVSAKSAAVAVEEDDDEEAGDEDAELVVPELGLLPDDGKSTLKEDPELDRRIIEGMLRDRKALLDDLGKEGMGQAAVLRRAAELGLSEALLRQVKGVAADLAGERPGRRPMPSSLGARTCLSCDRVFLSTGPGNRLCMRCRGGDAGLAQF